MKEIKIYEAFDGKQFEKKKDCEEYEAKYIQIKTEGVEWYDEDFEPLAMSIDNWDKVKILKFKDEYADENFCRVFSTISEKMDKDLDEKFNEYSYTNVLEENTLLIWDKDKKEWCYFEDILNAFEDLKTFIKNCREIIN